MICINDFPFIKGTVWNVELCKDVVDTEILIYKPHKSEFRSHSFSNSIIISE